MKKEGRAGKREALAIARAETAEAALKAERKLRFQFEEKVKAQLMGPQSLVPTVFFPALGEVAVRKDALHLHAEIAEAALHAGAASLTEMKGDIFSHLTPFFLLSFIPSLSSSSNVSIFLPSAFCAYPFSFVLHLFMF